ncbi:hypothetical protein ACH40F_46510 [Streptomyces sp. NPDC020794]|uniref:hypothetical protein n=1 Tax=unclassified Streptomyces TaxID=2593676 RepID=UPI0036EE50FC
MLWLPTRLTADVRGMGAATAAEAGTMMPPATMAEATTVAGRRPRRLGRVSSWLCLLRIMGFLPIDTEEFCGVPQKIRRDGRWIGYDR